ncbi:alcohol oxidase [Lindgomyces ingoldianus]|uniref:Alcohol oxidase n=1 Tax=Lindgomyces ingoldianus TaxID=673940 RepID=A0ACB6R4H1_9PLEO|nr:alcohol oxidase [Lindgomyces ingoldianus]KAF2473723.1 alcohol oxidase [Lindgomyces ingoldianus]
MGSRVFSISLATILTTAWAAPAETAERFGYANILQRGTQVRDAYDYIIAGAGTAGLTLADRLTADGKYSVLVIEYCYPSSNGRNFLDPGISYNISSIPQVDMNNREQQVRIGCCVGGSSAINGMVFVRGTKPEYDGWAELGGTKSTWDWNGVLPYFKKASHFNPPDEVLAKNFNITWDPEVWGQDPDTHIYASYPNYEEPVMIPFYNAAAKMPKMPIPKDGAGGKSGLFWFPTSMDNQKYWRSYSRTGHYDNIKRDNYDVITMHKVKKILFDGTTATGVQFSPRDTNQTLTARARKEVIISAGTVHTPQILQNSGIGPKDLLTQAKIPILIELPGVGQNFQDHAYLAVNYQWGNGSGPIGPNITQTGNPSSIAGPNLGAWIGLPTMTDDFEKIASRYEAQDPAQYLPKNTHPTVIAGYKAFQKLHAKLLRSTNSNWLWLPIFGQPGGIVMSMHVVSHGTINIDPANPDAEPIVDYRALSNPIDLDIMVENIRYMRKFMNSSAFAASRPTETGPGINVEGNELKEWIKSVLIPTNFHPIATAAKKPKEMGGVVDEELRVHGTKGLRIVDGSIMPTLPGANTQQSVYMIAEKVSLLTC